MRMFEFEYGGEKLCYLVSGSESVHRAHLVRAESLGEHVDGAHLAAEDALLVHVRGGADVALVEGLK